MAIKRVEIKDFLVFKGEFAANFCTGVNVLIGGNGTGKTTLLKLMYACIDISNSRPYALESVNVGDYFNTDMFKKVFFNTTEVRIFDTDVTYKSEKENGFNTDDDYYVGLSRLPVQIMLEFNRTDDVVFIPSTEILSHAKGLLALYHDREISFDKSEISLLAKTEKGSKREVSDLSRKILDKLSAIIGGDVIYKNGDFFLDRIGVGEVKFSLEASGYKKLGALWKLLRNGSFEKNSSLFWDEPENSLNPELVPKLVDILLELSRNGVQIFIATHSEILASYFAVNRQNGDEVMFASLYKDDGQIKANTNDRFDLLTPNNLTEEPVKLYERKLDRGLGGE
jgi:predicted ATPase